jgi:hypothetical protein
MSKQIEMAEEEEIETKLSIAPFVCRKVVFFWKIVSLKSEFRESKIFFMFGSVMKNKLETLFSV